MKKNVLSLISAALIASIMVLPFALLEFTLSPLGRNNFPFPLFLFLWLISTAFIVILRPAARGFRAGNDLTAHPIDLALRVIFSALILVVWAGIIIDQLPCFLGFQTATKLARPPARSKGHTAEARTE
ncbi:MAG: hypothetical protein ABR530_10875 [Pyrinomonadaceae bacterium]